MADVTMSIAEMEYEAFRSDNAFKKHANGKYIFIKWRLADGKDPSYSDTALAKMFGVSRTAFKNQRRRLKNKVTSLKDKIENGTLNKDMRKKHIDNVQKTTEKVQKFDKVPDDNNNQRKRPSDYSLSDHIADELLLIGGPETKDWMEILLYVSKYLFVNELTTYRTMQNRLLKAINPRDLKLYADITDKKAGKIRDMISDYIGQWGTLHSRAVTETLSEQGQKINRLAGIVAEAAPEKMLQIVEILDGELPTSESDAILAEIMSEGDDDFNNNLNNKTTIIDEDAGEQL